MSFFKSDTVDLNTSTYVAGVSFFFTGHSYHCGVKWQTKTLSQARIADNVIMPLFLLQCQQNFTPFL